MDKFANLKNEINKIMEENKPTVIYNSDVDRAIRELEKFLLSGDVKKDIHFNLAELMPEKAEESFANGQFKYREYQLSWMNAQDSFRLVLTNIPHKNSKVVIKIPDGYKECLREPMERFYKKITDKE
jgi:signal recognition particle GTPase